MRSWKTSLAGIIAGLALTLPTIINAATTPEGKVNWSLIIAGASVAICGIVAKDGNVTGKS